MTTRAAALRAEFDRGFADPPPPPRPAPALCLAITVADRPYAVALEEVRGLFADRPVSPLPSHVPGCLGLAQLAGEIVPVHGLRSLLGHPAGGMPRWLLRTGAVALGFDRLEGCLQFEKGELASGGEGPIAGLLAGRPLLNLAALTDEIAKQEN
jgi:purine-binding chemotaxis protein CheW